MRSAIVTLGILALAGCAGRDSGGGSSGGPASGKSGSDIVIVAAWPWAAHGQLLYGKGLSLATDEINAAGGVNGRKIRIEQVDDHESVDEGRMAAQQTVRRTDVAAVIGHLQSFITVPAASIYDAGGFIHVVPTSTDPSLTAQGYRHVFRLIFNDGATGRYMADAAHAAHRSRMAIYYIHNGYGRSLANAFEERALALGMEVIDRRSYDESATVGSEDYSQIVRDWKQRKLDGVFIAAEAPAGAAFAKALVAGGVNVPLYGSDAMAIPDLITAGGSAVEGMILPVPFHPDDKRDEVKRFAAAFHQKYGVAPDASAALAYDAVQTVAGAISRGHSTRPDSIAAALHGMTVSQGVTGDLAFDDVGERRHAPIVSLVVRNGAFVLNAAPTTTVATRQ